MLVIVGVLNQFDVATTALEHLLRTTARSDILLIDNGSDRPLAVEPWVPPAVTIVRNSENVGVYPLFEQGLALAGAHDLLAFFHSDLLIYETNWDLIVEKAFAGDSRLGLLGFVGSSEIDPAGLAGAFAQKPTVWKAFPAWLTVGFWGNPLE